jgi:hypothetical protein
MMLDYTNSLKSTLEATTEHAASLMMAQSELLQKLDQQQNMLQSQNMKFWEMLTTN